MGVDAAQGLGVLTRPLSRYYLQAGGRRGLPLGYASVAEDRIEVAFELLLQCLRAFLPHAIPAI